MKNRKFVFLIGFLCLMGTFVGCGPKNPLGVVKATGTITMDAQPVAGALVTFIPKSEGEGKHASATTDANGVYVLSTQGAGDVMGAVPGTYNVTVIKNEAEQPKGKDSDVPPEERQITDSYAAAKVIRHIAAKYAAPSSSGLTATVEKGGNNVFDFTVEK
jgi:hypothetical protein